MKKNKFTGSVGKKIREARKQKAWTQGQLAGAVHVEPTTVSMWERGKRAPSLEMLVKIAEALDRPIGYFVPGHFQAKDVNWLLMRSLSRQIRELQRVMYEFIGNWKDEPWLLLERV